MIGGMAMTETIELFVHISYTTAAQNFTDFSPQACCGRQVLGVCISKTTGSHGIITSTQHTFM